MKRFAPLFFLIIACLSGSAQTNTETIVQHHPVIQGDLPDPSILRVGKIYYASGTSSEWSPQFPLYTSTDLKHWQQRGYVFPKTPAWAASSYWAPELFYRKGTYYVYYAARRTADGIGCIGVATSKDPLKGFTDHGVLLQWGKEAIDPFVIEDSGKLYMSFKAYGLDSRPIELLCVQLSDDGLQVAGTPFMLLRDDERKGMEGECIIKRNGAFYLFYSFGDCCGKKCSYQVGVAKATSLKGGYAKYENNPVVTESDYWKCTGHGTITTTPDGRYFYLYHAYNKEDNIYTGRQAMLGEVTWDKTTGWPSVQPVDGLPPANFRDDFAENTLPPAWQWDMRHTQPNIRLFKGVLYLSGTTTSDNKTGTALTVRPTTGTYKVTTKVINCNASLKGLVVYGDANQSVGIGVQDSLIQVWEIKDNVRKILQQIVAKKQPVYLKITADKGYQLRFYWGDAPDDWHELNTENDYYNGGFLPQWDRSPRPGIMQQGDTAMPAAFEDFEIGYE